MDRFWRSVSIMMGALLAAGCPVRTKYGIETGDTGEADRQEVAIPADVEGAPLPVDAPERPIADLRPE